MKKLFLLIVLVIICGCDTTTKDESKTISSTSTSTKLSKTDYEILTEYVNRFSLPTEITGDIQLINEEDEFLIEWKTSHSSILTKYGEYKYPILDQIVILTGTFKYNKESIKREFEIMVKGYNDENLVNYVFEQDTYDYIVLEDRIDLSEKTVKTVNITYKSLNKEILNDEGVVNLLMRDVPFSIEILYKKNDIEKIKIVNMIIPSTVEQNIPFLKENQFDINYAQNLTMDNDKNNLKLVENKLEGIYYSKIYHTTFDFESLVGCFNMNTNKNNTCELQAKILVEGKWSKYFTYGEFGLFLENSGNSSSDSIAKIYSDEIKPLNQKKATGFMYKVTLKRKNHQVNESLRQITISLKNSSFVEENLNFDDDVNYNVPMLNQNIVPVIGNSICSPTTITMLLKYKGENFTEFDEFENRFIANLAKDYGNNIFGNWVYNCITASSFGYNAYPKYINTIEELKHHLTNVGPVGASVSGDLGLYKTGGHLLVVKGYYKNDLGNEFIRINDPNLKSVEYNYSLEVFLKVWKNLIYVIE